MISNAVEYLASLDGLWRISTKYGANKL